MELTSNALPNDSTAAASFPAVSAANLNTAVAIKVSLQPATN